MPPAFVLSQDQTLKLSEPSIRKKNTNRQHITKDLNPMHKSFCVNFCSGYTGRSLIENRQTKSKPAACASLSYIYNVKERTEVSLAPENSNYIRDFEPRCHSEPIGPGGEARRLIRPTPPNRQILILKKMTCKDFLSQGGQNFRYFPPVSCSSAKRQPSSPLSHMRRGLALE